MGKRTGLVLLLLCATAQAQDNSHVFKSKPHPIRVVVRASAVVQKPSTDIPLTWDAALVPGVMGTVGAPEQLNVYDATLYLPDKSEETVTLVCKCKLVAGLDYWARSDKGDKVKPPGKLQVIYGNSKRQWEETAQYK